MLKRLSSLLIIYTALLSCTSSQTVENDPHWQFFIDEYWIADSDNVHRTLHQPRKFNGNPIIFGDRPWEENPYCFGSVIFDDEESIFKLWYQSYNFDLKVSERTPILYATSTDGMNWEQPNLGIVEFQGTTNNNIVMQNYGYHDLYSPSVIKDKFETNPNRRYKMIWWDFPLGKTGYQDDGMCVAFSPDGIHWEKYPHNPVLHALKSEQSISDVMSVMQDSQTGLFIAYTKGWADPWPAFRQIVRAESQDFINWSEPQVVLTHNNDSKDPQSYGMSVSQIGSVYLGLLHSYKNPGDETIDVQLAISHDNQSWERAANQQTFIPLGKDGTWDDGMIFCAPLINHKDKTMIYYGGWNGPHNSRKDRKSGIGLATLRKNSFVSMDADQAGGTLITHPIQNAGGQLRINADAGKGKILVELINSVGDPIPGYTMDECFPMQSKKLSHIVQWDKKSKIPQNEGSFQIRFTIKNASLYCFSVGKNAIRKF